ncbi:hypothetical protein EZI54_07220 [Marinobacter halodurans]|uniref:YqaJ viral recombinase domain-containing protein n=1 Tax=Marinobacter halodurans TaxID=2528979 RepID=A0ABY1ZQC8_9GAMM|nr:YqaJ viral recombinase family protein [Marinobacter halodurans]TBW57442.1 hypothetical protein EZI54_07220 [Marinobacter halodurans]
MSDQIKAQVRAVIDALPQRAVIPDHVADRWIDGIAALDPSRAVWHAERLRGFGGSEVGELLRYHLGMEPKFSSPSDIVAEKLLLKLPDQDNPHIRRGRVFESLAQYVYEKLTGRRSVKDRMPYSSVFNAPHREASFAVGNPDDINESPAGVIIPDFKIRSSLDWSEDLELNYVAQLHWYGSIYMSNAAQFAAPEKIAHYCLAELDVPNAMLDGLNWKLNKQNLSEADQKSLIERMGDQIAETNFRGFGMRVTAFDHDPQLAADLMAIAGKLWNDHVLTGNPFYEPVNLKTAPPETLDHARRLTEQLSDARLAEKAAGEESSRLLKELREIGKEYDLSGMPPLDTECHAPMSVTQNRSIDLQSAARYLIAQDGIDPNALVDKEKKTLNADRALQLLNENGIDPSPAYDFPFDRNAVKGHLKLSESASADQFESPGFSVRLSTKKDEKAIVERQKDAMSHYLKKFSGLDEELEEEPEHSLSLG